MPDPDPQGGPGPDVDIELEERRSGLVVKLVAWFLAILLVTSLLLGWSFALF